MTNGNPLFKALSELWVYRIIDRLAFAASWLPGPIIQDLLLWKVILNDGTSILEAIEIQKRYRLGFWDALVIQAAIKGRADILLSEDFESGRLIDGLTVRNPFISPGRRVTRP